jgi:hypothetical protein
MKAEITFDLVMGEDMSFVEGCYKLDGGPWQVFIFPPPSERSTIEVRTNLVWASGVTGLNAFVPKEMRLNKSTVLKVLSHTLGVDEWVEVRGPDSIVIR